ncbi:P-loop containing nucleoside triphosphate hydrolase protein [Aspergillus multicolor]|uniref:P-loop containing nucleoside triphosphate hydrolase protein n=1 Tax=Aspergillus multicolor TaxID=41759 RepID=UPI003CCE2BB6
MSFFREAKSKLGRGSNEAPPTAESLSAAGNDQGLTDFRGGREARPTDVFIAIMGVTGAGKSSFISCCSGGEVKVGHGLEACTAEVGVYAYDVSPERTVYLIDTPGFDDTTRSDSEVLKEIAGWLVSSYKGKILLSGIIYLHRISDVRMQGSAKKNLLMFRKLCGEEALKKVILVTTMWDKVPETEATQREQELVRTSEFWGWMLAKGSCCRRHKNTVESAKAIVDQLAGHPTAIATNLQKQMVDEKKNLGDTSAGQEVQSEIERERAKWVEGLKDLTKELKQALEDQDREAEEVLRAERDRYEKLMLKSERDTDALRATLKSLLEERDARVAWVEQQMREQQEAHAAEMEIMNQHQQRLEEEQQRLEDERAEMENSRDQRSTRSAPSSSGMSVETATQKVKRGIRDWWAKR